MLRAAGIEFDIVAANVDESVLAGETPDAHVRRLAEAKAGAVRHEAGQRAVLAADTVVVIDSAILGKPADEEDARRTLRMLSGRAHVVMTGVCLIHPHGPARAGHDEGPAEAGRDLRQTAVAQTTVELAPLTDGEIAWYVASGEPAGKAGAYAIQGLASRFVTRIEGSYSNVVGLPVELVYVLCKRAGVLVS